ncbi:L,D-transpeptidase family protein [Metabacillus sp. 84]|uniref:L,D-transpeptidase family protein n=1 Tax=unclassified Metabacillus TaxID=2675274 RepID=UPI003CF29889
MKKLMCLIVLAFSLVLAGNVPAASAAGDQLIIINKSINKLAFFDHGKLIRTFRIATGRNDSLTPEGTFKIVSKIVNRPYYTNSIPGGDPRNPLGDRWLGLDARGTYGTTYAIHGNNNESSIGKYVSSGCVRMHNSDVRWLYPQVEKMTKVIILKSGDSFETIARKKGYSLKSQYSAYSAAGNQGKKLMQATAKYKSIISSGSITRMHTLYDGVTSELRATEKAIGKVPGKSKRNDLLKKYVTPAKITIAGSMYEMSQHRLMLSIKQSISSGQISKAQSQLAALDRLQAKTIQFKKSGSYPRLPASISASLEGQEADLYGMILQIRTRDYNKAIAGSSITSLDRQYGTLVSAISATEREIGQVPGASIRQAKLTQYIKPAKISRERTMNQVSMHRLLNYMDRSIKSGATSRARQKIAAYEQLRTQSAAIQKAHGYPFLQNLEDGLNKRFADLKTKL